MLDEARGYIEQARTADPKSVSAAAEMGHNTVARATLLIQDNKKSDAKKLVEAGLAELKPPQNAKLSKKKSGAYNALLDLALRNKLVSKKAPYAMKQSKGKSLGFEYPYGVGWEKEGVWELDGDGLISLRRYLGKDSMRIGVSSFEWGTSYNGAPTGENTKGMLKFRVAAWEKSLISAKSRTVSSSALPRWVKKPVGAMVQGTDEGRPKTVWFWIFKTRGERRITYQIQVEVVGDFSKKVPPQLAAILKSLEELE